MAKFSSKMLTALSNLMEAEQEFEHEPGEGMKAVMNDATDFSDFKMTLVGHLQDLFSRKMVDQGFFPSSEAVENEIEKLQKGIAATEAKQRYIETSSLPARTRVLFGFLHIEQKIEDADDISDFNEPFEQLEALLQREAFLAPSELEFEVAKFLRDESLVDDRIELSFGVPEGDKIRQLSFDEYETWLAQQQRIPPEGRASEAGKQW